MKKEISLHDKWANVRKGTKGAYEELYKAYWGEYP